jgi:two-component system response regulator MprA
VLLAEDDRAIRHALERALSLEGYQVTAVADGVEALAQAHRTPPDVLLLDVMMPGIDGLQVCRVLRAEGDRTPILMLTALVETADRIAGLDAGADDYVAKPFRLAELLARLRALLRHAGPAAVSAGAIRVDGATRRAFAGDQELDLTPKEFDLLALFAAEPGQAIRRERIMDEVWDPNWFGSTKTLDVHMSALRRKLGDAARLETVRGIGYRLETGPPCADD